jgi:hypothetical protein
MKESHVAIGYQDILKLSMGYDVVPDLASFLLNKIAFRVSGGFFTRQGPLDPLVSK